MLLQLVLASLRRRFRQLALIALAVGVAAGTVATLAGFSTRVEQRLGESLAAFGPNLLVRPQVGGLPRIPAAELARVRAVPGVRTATGIPPGGLDFERIEVRTDPKQLAGVARAIEGRVAGVEARPLLRASESDARLTRRLTLVLLAVSAVSLGLALLSVGAATTALVGERRTEIGLFLALGFTARRVGVLFATELLATALLAATLGEVLGEVAARGLANSLLGAGGGGPLFTLSGFAAAALAAVLVVGLSMTVALSRVERLDPARVLKGE
ncbi:MAG TPA: FtsX-like permease family protein [Thermoanaerobaculia bacterium]|nr:FtsX-like permease family protein [Thermoanaerobaculia bacterium]